MVQNHWFGEVLVERRFFYRERVVTFGVLGVIPSYLAIILHKICVFEKNKNFDVTKFFSVKNLRSRYFFPPFVIIMGRPGH